MSLYKNDFGTLIRVSTGIDLTGATAQLIKMVKPDGTLVSFDAINQDSNPVNGVLEYTTEDGDINQSGTYHVQAFVTFTNREHAGDEATFIVLDRIGAF